MKKRKGAALVLVIITFLLISILMLVMSSYAMANIRVSVRQQENIRAYYYTLAGMELGTAALNTTRDSGGPDGMVTLFNDFATGAASVSGYDVGNPLRDIIRFTRDPDAAYSATDNPYAAIVTIDVYGEDRGTPAVPEIWVVLDVSTQLLDATTGTNTIAVHGERTSFLASSPAREEHIKY